MVRQIASQPLIPCLIDFVDRAQFGICAHGSIDDSNDPEVDTVKVRIGAEMIADNIDLCPVRPCYVLLFFHNRQFRKGDRPVALTLFIIIALCIQAPWQPL